MKKLYTLIIPKFTLFFALITLTFGVSGQSYIQSVCDFAPLTTDGTILCLGDDEMSAAIPIGFTFNFYEFPFTDVYISSNGYMSFTAGLGAGCCTGAVLPSVFYTNTIFFAHEDLDPNFCVDGDITYYTVGAPGSQIFVMSFTDVPHYNIGGDPAYFPVTTQVQLYEGTDEIKIVTTTMNGDGGLSTMGLNENGFNADIVVGRNSANWSVSNECISFLPDGIPDDGCTDPTAVNYDPGADIDDGSCFFGYTYSTCTYETMATTGTVVCINDDGTTAGIDMGFGFPFYGAMHDTIYIAGNGFVTFNGGLGSACCTGIVLPSGLFPNTIFLGQEDLDPNFCADGEINYYSTGTPGNMIFVVNYIDVPHYSIGADPLYFPVTMQLQLHEATNDIKIVVTDWESDGGAATLGLNYNDVASDAAPGKNSSVWTAIEECHLWSPIGGPAPVCEIPSELFVDGITTDDAVLHWNEVEGADQYRVTLQNTATGLIKTKGFYTNSVDLTDKLNPLTTYGFRVKTVCYDDLEEISNPSEWFYFTTLGRLGEDAASVSLFPNPSNGTFTLELNGLESANFNMMVYDAIGNVVYAKTINSNSGNYSETIALDVAAGIYIVTIKNEMHEMNYPVIIQK